MLSRFHTIPACHGQTDGQTDRIAISISRVSVPTRDKTNEQPRVREGSPMEEVGSVVERISRILGKYQSAKYQMVLLVGPESFTEVSYFLLYVIGRTDNRFWSGRSRRPALCHAQLTPLCQDVEASWAVNNRCVMAARLSSGPQTPGRNQGADRQRST